MLCLPFCNPVPLLLGETPALVFETSKGKQWSAGVPAYFSLQLLTPKRSSKLQHARARVDAEQGRPRGVGVTSKCHPLKSTGGRYECFCISKGILQNDIPTSRGPPSQVPAGPYGAPAARRGPCGASWGTAGPRRAPAGPHGPPAGSHGPPAGARGVPSTIPRRGRAGTGGECGGFGKRGERAGHPKQYLPPCGMQTPAMGTLCKI
eukprot:gene15070-biopygen18672